MEDTEFSNMYKTMYKILRQMAISNLIIEDEEFRDIVKKYLMESIHFKLNDNPNKLNLLAAVTDLNYEFQDRERQILLEMKRILETY